MRSFRSLLAIVAVLGLVGCASSTSKMRIHSSYDPGANFTDLKTYKFKGPLVGKGQAGEESYDRMLNKRIQRAVTTEMNKKGFEVQSSGTPDFWIAYHAFLAGKVREKQMKVMTDLRDLGSPTKQFVDEYKLDLGTYDEGSLVLVVIDSGTSQKIWDGSAEAEIQLNVDLKEKEKRVNKAVKKILKKFPPTD